MAGVVLVPPKFMFLDAVGNPLANGKVDVYLAGTTTRTPTWQDQGQSILNTNPITLDANGSCTMVVDDSLTYKLVVKNSDNVEQTHAGGDNIVGGTTRLSQVSFTQAGAGAVARSGQDKMRETVTPEDFGAVGDGSADDTTPIANALATGKRIKLRDGATYKVTSARSTTDPLYMSGNATIKFAFVGIGLSCTGSVVEISGVTFDGNDQCHRALYGSGQTSVLLDGCTVKNVYGTGLGGQGFTAGVRFDAPARIRIIRSNFIKIRGLSNGVEGDAAGAVRAIFLSGAIGFGLIGDCYFEDINNQDGAGVINSEDADAIQGQALITEAQHLTVRDCHFTNCGKRAAKFQGGSASTASFIGNTVDSGWTVPAGVLPGLNDSKSMASVASVYGGSLVFSGNTSYGGVIMALVEAGDTVNNLECIHVSNNVHTPLYAIYGFRGLAPAKFYIDSTNPRGTGHVVDLVESGNYYSGLQARSVLKVRDFVSVANRDDTIEHVCKFDAVQNVSAIGNIHLGANTDTNPGYQFVNNSFAAATFLGNVFSGQYDCIYFGAALNGGTYKVSIVGNSFLNSVRNDVSEFTAAGDKANYSYVGNNTTKATSDLHTLRGVTSATASIGAAGAPPAQVAAYETVTINATTYKRPLYNT